MTWKQIISIIPRDKAIARQYYAVKNSLPIYSHDLDLNSKVPWGVTNFVNEESNLIRKDKKASAKVVKRERKKLKNN